MATAATSKATMSKGTSGDTQPRLGVRLRRSMSVRNASALYLFVILFAAFALWEPGTFLTLQTWQVLLDSQAVSGLVAIGLIAPSAPGSSTSPSDRRPGSAASSSPGCWPGTACPYRSPSCSA